jgi:dolichol-phosphate mannosyltransferase
MNQLISGNVLRVGETPEIDVSIVCPFYNEEQIIEWAIRSFLDRLKGHMPVSWELIVVNDGSRDGSLAIAQEIARTEPNLRVLSYDHNRGRGHALRVGIGQARGKIIVTTEIDLSWGEDIVERLYQAMVDHSDVDIVVASPHLPGGGYKNVPAKRVFFSSFGNWVIRACMSNVATMNTGMTRAYRRESIRTLPLEEDGKEFHLEVILKARALKYRFFEIPAILEWKEHKHAGGGTQKRKSSSRTNKLVISHTLFSLFANPIRYIWVISAAASVLSFGFITAAIIRYAAGEVAVFAVIIGLGLAIMAVMFFAFGVVFQQGSMTQRELWRLQRSLAQAGLQMNDTNAVPVDTDARSAETVDLPRRVASADRS